MKEYVKIRALEIQFFLFKIYSYVTAIFFIKGEYARVKTNRQGFQNVNQS